MSWSPAFERLERASVSVIRSRGMARFGEESRRQVNKLERVGESGDRLARSLGPHTLKALGAGDRASEGWCRERHERSKLGNQLRGQGDGEPGGAWNPMRGATVIPADHREGEHATLRG